MCSEVSLTWNEHQSTLVGVFKNLLESSTFVDCTIAAEGQYLKAHKIILSACSPYLEMLFRQESEKNPIVVLKDIKFQELKAVVDFIYSGKVIVPQKRLGNFVDAAESLQIKGIDVGNKRKTNQELAGKRETEYSLLDHNEEEHTSSLPPKHSNVNNNEDHVRGISSVIDLNVETKTDKELQLCETYFDVPNSSEVNACPPLTNLSESSMPFQSSECSEQENLDTKESISFVEESILPESEQSPDIDAAVVKNEPEEIAEVLLPEIDCFEDPKDEDLQETALDSASAEKESVMGDSQRGSTQYSALQTVLQASSSSLGTAADLRRPGNLLLFSPQGPSGPVPFIDGGGINGNQSSFRNFAILHSPVASNHKAILRLIAVPSIVARTPKANQCNASLPSSNVTASTTTQNSATLISSRVNALTKTGKTSTISSVSASAFKASPRFVELSSSESKKEKQRLPPQDGALKNSRKSVFSRSRSVIGNFMPSSDIKRRHRPLHSEDKFKCEHCSKRFKDRSSLPRHLRIHTGEKPYVCKVCAKSFIDNYSLRVHLRIHTGNTPYRCEECGKGFTTDHSLKLHRRIHRGEKPYVCPNCGKAFRQKATLQGHIRTHTGERPYVCKVCGKSFTVNSSLQSHLRIHTGDKPFKCKECGKRFTMEYTLKVHLRIHSGEKPYMCANCGKAFRHKATLQHHLGTHDMN